MQRSVELDADGLPLGFYTDDALPAPPAGAIAITDAIYEALLAAPGRAVLRDGVVAPYLPPAPALPAPTQVNFLAFLALFTTAEQAAIVNSTDPRIKLFCLMAAGAVFVDLADPRVIAGTDLLESLGLIGAGRAAQVLAGHAPPTA